MQQDKPRILLVEDDEAHANLIRRAFDSHGGMELTVAATLEEARGRLGTFSPDLVVADLMLADGKGTELISGNENEAHIPVVVMTSFGNEQAAVEAMKAGALDYLVKSAITLADIPHVVERALREWRRILGRRQVEDQLQEEGNRAREYLNIAAVILVALDKAGNITLLNRKGHEVLGYEEGELVGCNWFDTCLPQRIRSEVWPVFEQLVAGDLARTEHYENPVVTKSGEERIISWHNTLLRNEAGAITATLASGEDITERKQAEEALARSEERWRSLTENAPDVVLTVDHQGRVLFINHTLSGVKREDVIGKPIHRFMPKEYARTVKASLEEVFRTGEPTTFESRASEACGAFWFSNRVGPVKENGEVVAATIIATDITERKRMEEALREAYGELEKKVEERAAELRDSEAKFRALFESSNDAVMLLDEKGFFDCNDAALHVFGCSRREEFIGKRPSELSPRTQPDGTDSLTAAEAKIALAIETGAAHFEWLHRRIDGTEFEADVLLSSTDLKGKMVLQAVVRDISERKRAEEAVLREQARLRRLLESSDRDRKLTAYEIHDGLAQHIAGAKMQLEAASHVKDENPEPAARAYERGLELLTRGLDEARRLISGLRPPVLDEAGVVAAIEHLARDPAMREGPEVDFIFNAQFGRLEPLLENAIFRIVQESVRNARRHSRSGKVQIRLTRKNGRIHIQVEDWGIGFDPDDIAETSFGIGGIRERARLLGGKATIDSSPGKGTRIIVDLPLVRTL